MVCAIKAIDFPGVSNIIMISPSRCRSNRVHFRTKSACLWALTSLAGAVCLLVTTSGSWGTHHPALRMTPGCSNLLLLLCLRASGGGHPYTQQWRVKQVEWHWPQCVTPGTDSIDDIWIPQIWWRGWLHCCNQLTMLRINGISLQPPFAITALCTKWIIAI